jgi:ATP-dependent helicase HrpA
VQRWERYDLRQWSFADLPERLNVTEIAGVTLCAFPGLETDGVHVSLKLFRKLADAETATRLGFARLVELGLQKELAWVQKDLRALEKSKDLLAGWTSLEDFLATAYENLRQHIIWLPQPLLPLSRPKYETALQQARERIPGLVPALLDRVTAILKLRLETMRHKGYAAPAATPRPNVSKDLRQMTTTAPQISIAPLGFLREELQRLLPANILVVTPFDRLPHLPRYLKALVVRADRALLNPAKDVEKAKQVQPFQDVLQRLGTPQDLSSAVRQELQEYRWLLEEFYVSTFAQELGTAQPVSPKRLQAQLQRVEAALRESSSSNDSSRDA